MRSRASAALVVLGTPLLLSAASVLAPSLVAAYPGPREGLHATLAQGDTIRARVDLVIGEDAAAAPGRTTANHIFSAISGIAVDRQGRIYASDLQQATVPVFSP